MASSGRLAVAATLGELARSWGLALALRLDLDRHLPMHIMLVLRVILTHSEQFCQTASLSVSPPSVVEWTGEIFACRSTAICWPRHLQMSVLRRDWGHSSVGSSRQRRLVGQAEGVDGSSQPGDCQCLQSPRFWAIARALTRFATLQATPIQRTPNLGDSSPAAHHCTALIATIHLVFCLYLSTIVVYILERHSRLRFLEAMAARGPRPRRLQAQEELSLQSFDPVAAWWDALTLLLPVSALTWLLALVLSAKWAALGLLLGGPD
jgi:hypothetical protein